MKRSTGARCLLAAGLMASCLSAWADPSSEFVVFADASNKVLKGGLDNRPPQLLVDASSAETKWAVINSGRQLAVFSNTSRPTNAVTIYDMSSGRPVLTQPVPKNTFITGPVFGSGSQYLLRTYDARTAGDGNKAFVANLRSGAVEGTLASGGIQATIDTLPDGTLFRIHGKTGLISTHGPSGGWRDIGRLAIPAGVLTIHWRLNHQGTKIAIDYSWKDASSNDRSDIWIADIDGSNQYRLTRGGYMGLPIWSPDDSRVAFRYDTLARFGASTGRCSYWHVPVESRDVSGISYDQPHAVARQMKVNNGVSKDYSACKILAWEK